MLPTWTLAIEGDVCGKELSSVHCHEIRGMFDACSGLTHQIVTYFIRIFHLGYVRTVCETPSTRPARRA